MSSSATAKASSTLLPICLLIIAMVSIQSGASLAKSLFPLVGAEGITTLRLSIGTLILFIIFRPWRMRFAAGSRLPLFIYGLALGAMNYLFLSFSAYSAARYRRGIGVHRPAGGRHVLFTPCD